MAIGTANHSLAPSKRVDRLDGHPARNPRFLCRIAPIGLLGHFRLPHTLLRNTWGAPDACVACSLAGARTRRDRSIGCLGPLVFHFVGPRAR